MTLLYCHQIKFTPNFDPPSLLYFLTIVSLTTLLFLVVILVLACAPGFFGKILKYNLQNCRLKEPLDELIQLKITRLFFISLGISSCLLIFLTNTLRLLPNIFVVLIFVLPVFSILLIFVFLKSKKDKYQIIGYISYHFWHSWLSYIFLVGILILLKDVPKKYYSLSYETFSLCSLLIIITISNYDIVAPSKRSDDSSMFTRLFLYSVFIILFCMNYFHIEHKISRAVATTSGIRTNNINLILNDEGCNIIRRRQPTLLVDQNTFECQTNSLNILFSIGRDCLIQAQDGKSPSFTIPCDSIISKQTVTEVSNPLAKH